jgi:transposase-like protein
MRRRKFSREFKVEAVRLVRERGVSAARAARDLDVHENVLRKWVEELAASADAFPGSESAPARPKRSHDANSKSCGRGWHKIHVVRC